MSKEEKKAELGTRENPITREHRDANRAHKYCKCDACGKVAQCTMTFDFYFTDDGAFKCEHCFRNHANDAVEKARREYAKTLPN